MNWITLRYNAPNNDTDQMYLVYPFYIKCRYTDNNFKDSFGDIIKVTHYIKLSPPK